MTKKIPNIRPSSNLSIRKVKIGGMKRKFHASALSVAARRIGPCRQTARAGRRP
jgi:hypothetical protein